MVLGWKVPMSNLLLNLSKKVLKFLYKIKKDSRSGGEGGKLSKSTWAFQKKIPQGSPNPKLASPRALAVNSRVGKC